MLQMSIEQIINSIFVISVPTLFISLAIISFYLIRNKVYSWWGIGYCFWPKLIWDYKSHTKNKLGRVGIFYYTGIGSLLVTVIFVLVDIVITLFKIISG